MKKIVDDRDLLTDSFDEIHFSCPGLTRRKFDIGVENRELLDLEMGMGLDAPNLKRLDGKRCVANINLHTFAVVVIGAIASSCLFFWYLHRYDL